MAVAPSLPHLVQRIRGPNDGTGTSSGQASMLTAVSWRQCRQVTNSPRTPFWRMLPSVMGRNRALPQPIGHSRIPSPPLIGRGVGPWVRPAHPGTARWPGRAGGTRHKHKRCPSGASMILRPLFDPASYGGQSLPTLVDAGPAEGVVTEPKLQGARRSTGMLTPAAVRCRCPKAFVLGIV